MTDDELCDDLRAYAAVEKHSTYLSDALRKAAAEIESLRKDRDERAVQKGEMFAEIENLRRHRERLRVFVTTLLGLAQQRTLPHLETINECRRELGWHELEDLP